MDANKKALLDDALKGAYSLVLCHEVTELGTPSRLVTYTGDYDCYITLDAQSKNQRKAIDVITQGADFVIKVAPAGWDGLINTMKANSYGLVLIGQNKASIYSLDDVIAAYNDNSGAKRYWGELSGDTQRTQPAPQQTPVPPSTPAPAMSEKITSSDATLKVANAFKNSGDLLNQLSQSAATKKETTNKVQQAFNNSDFFKNMSGGNK